MKNKSNTLTEVKVVEVKDDNDIMTTIKIPFRCSDADKLSLIDLQRQYSILVKSALCRLLDDISVNDTRKYLNYSLNNVNDLDTRFSENAILDSQASITKMKKSYKKAIKKNKNLTWKEFINKKENRICFKRKNLEKRRKGEISKEEFKENKYLPLTNYGETAADGNRKFYLNMVDNECIFKLNRNKHLHLKLCKTNKNYLNELIKIQQLMEECSLSVTFKIDKNYLHISYKPIKNDIAEVSKLALMDNRIVGVDLNPNNIGLSVLEFKKDLADYEFAIKDKRFIDINEINKMPKNKKKRAYIGIVDNIISYLKAFNTKNIALEDLHMPSKDHGKGADLNNCLNKWNRNLIINNLKKKCRIEGINIYITDAKYSTTIGNLMYDYYDPINSSIEVGRRGFLYKKIGLKEHFFPEIKLKKTLDLWKDSAGNRLNSWIDIHNHVKKTLKLRIRVPLDERGSRRICIKNIPICIF